MAAKRGFVHGSPISWARTSSPRASGVSGERDRLRLWGFAAVPTYHRAQANMQFTIVNGRPVRDRLIMGAIRGAYADVLTRGRFPALALFLDCPPDADRRERSPGQGGSQVPRSGRGAQPHRRRHPQRHRQRRRAAAPDASGSSVLLGACGRPQPPAAAGQPSMALRACGHVRPCPGSPRRAPPPVEPDDGDGWPLTPLWVRRAASSTTPTSWPRPPMGW